MFTEVSAVFSCDSLCYFVDVFYCRVLSLFIVFGLDSTLVTQQTKPAAHITIHVDDVSGASIPKAHIEILDESTTFTKKLDADDRGDLSIDLPIGTYEVTASLLAFKPAKKRIEVQDTTHQNVTFMLNVAVGGPTVEVLPEPISLPAQKPSCGPSNIEFEVRTSKHQPDKPAEPGKAKVYVVQTSRKPFFEPQNPVIRIGVDGNWIGATKKNSYLAFSVGPGEHHLCAQWQPTAKNDSRKIGFAAFTAEVGKQYYFRDRTILHLGLELEHLDPDEGQFLVSSSALSISQPKK
jgi:carboxypeptidase family protein